MSEITPQEAYEALIYVSAPSFYYPPHPELEIKCARALDWAREIAQKAARGELVPVVHAHWIDDGDNVWVCSHCGLMWGISNDGSPEENEMLYCPKCSALMGEKDDSHA